MGEITYVNPGWVDGSTVPINKAALDNISNSLHKVVNKTDRTAAGETLDADNATTVSGYGIGVQTPTTMATSLNNYTLPGLYFDPGSLTNSAFVADASIVLVMAYTAEYLAQIATLVSATNTPKMRIRIKYNNVWSTIWSDIWNGYSDGNGGQQPAPKPFTTANAVGEWKYCTRYVGGASDDTGTWAYIVFSSAGAVEGASVAAGGTDLGAGKLALCWKVIA